MGRVGLLSGLAIAALVVGGCSAVTPGDPGSDNSPAASTGSPTRTAVSRGGGLEVDSSTRPGSVSSGPVFPLTVRRTGGIAGYDDTVVLRADGKVLVDTTTVRGRVCTLSATQRGLLGVLSTLPLVDGGVGSSTGGAGDPGDPGAGSGDDPADPSDPFATADPLDPSDPSDPSVESDRIMLSVADGRGRTLDLSESSLGSVLGSVDALVVDVTLSNPAVTSCTTRKADGRTPVAPKS